MKLMFFKALIILACALTLPGCASSDASKDSGQSKQASVAPKGTVFEELVASLSELTVLKSQDLGFADGDVLAVRIQRPENRTNKAMDMDELVAELQKAVKKNPALVMSEIGKTPARIIFAARLSSVERRNQAESVVKYRLVLRIMDIQRDLVLKQYSAEVVRKTLR